MLSPLRRKSIALAALLTAALLILCLSAFTFRRIETWKRNGVLCYTTRKGKNRGVACTLNGKRLAIVNQRYIIVGAGSKVLYTTRSH